MGADQSTNEGPDPETSKAEQTDIDGIPLYYRETITSLTLLPHPRYEGMQDVFRYLQKQPGFENESTSTDDAFIPIKLPPGWSILKVDFANHEEFWILSPDRKARVRISEVDDSKYWDFRRWGRVFDDDLDARLLDQHTYPFPDFYKVLDGWFVLNPEHKAVMLLEMLKEIYHTKESYRHRFDGNPEDVMATRHSMDTKQAKAKELAASACPEWKSLKEFQWYTTMLDFIPITPKEIQSYMENLYQNIKQAGPDVDVRDSYEQFHCLVHSYSRFIQKQDITTSEYIFGSAAEASAHVRMLPQESGIVWKI